MPWDGKSIKRMLTDIVFLTQPSGDVEDLTSKPPQDEEDMKRRTWPGFEQLRPPIRARLALEEGEELTLADMKRTSSEWMMESTPVREKRLSFHDKSSLFWAPAVLALLEEPDRERLLAKTPTQVRSASLISLHLSSLIIIIGVIVITVPTGGPHDTYFDPSGIQEAAPLRSRPGQGYCRGDEVPTSPLGS